MTTRSSTRVNPLRPDRDARGRFDGLAWNTSFRSSPRGDRKRAGGDDALHLLHCIDTWAFLEYTPFRNMTPAISQIDAARQRVQAAYDPELLRTAGHRLVELLADHLGRGRGGGGRRAAVAASDGKHPPGLPNCCGRRPLPMAGREELVAQFGRLVQTMLDRGHNLHHPRYIGHQVAASGADRRADGRRRLDHEPGDGDLRHGPLGHGGRMGHGQRTGPPHRLGRGDVLRAGHARRLAGQPDRVADGAERRPGRLLAARHGPIGPAAVAGGPCRRPLLGGADGRHPGAGHAAGRARGPGRSGGGWIRKSSTTRSAIASAAVTRSWP